MNSKKPTNKLKENRASKNIKSTQPLSKAEYIFEVLISDKTRYIVNREKQYVLERLTKALQLSITQGTTIRPLTPVNNFTTEISLYRKYLLDLSCVLVTVQTVAFLLKKEAVTIEEIIKHLKRYYTLEVVNRSKNLIVTAIINGYMEDKKNHEQHKKNEEKIF